MLGCENKTLEVERLAVSESMTGMHAHEGEDDDYEVIRVSISWGMLSILVFAVILTTQLFGLRVFGLRLSQVVATLPLSVAGLVLGGIGFKFGRARRAAKIGLFLNGVVLFCVFVFVPLAFLARRWLS